MSLENKQHFNFIISASKRMMKLIEGLLDFARAGRKIAEFKEVDLNQLLATTLDNLKFQIQEAGVQVQMDHLPSIQGDAVQLMILFQNLISNAVKYRSQDRPSLVQVTAHQNADSWILCVKDNGLGFDPKEKDAIFQPFKRLRGAAHQEGAGIGLATVKRVVEAHCGKIWCGTEPGTGSAFYISLPKSHSINDACSAAQQEALEMS
jgi:signal transduction histidine kinase